jgi:putative hemolysin
MKKPIILLFIVFITCFMIFISGCEIKAENKLSDNTGNVGIANPASVNCIDNGGKLEIATDANGGQYGLCKLPDGTICEEWDYFKGDCPKNTSADCGICPQFSSPAPGFCTNGNIVDGGKDECGCQMPPKCEAVACTEEAKLCPDGSSVARIGPDCEFAACPNETGGINDASNPSAEQELLYR